MVHVGLMVRLEAKPGKEVDVESFLRDQLAFAQGEPETTAWFAMRLGPRTFAIFDAFPDESGREAHLSGQIAEELKSIAPTLLKKPPTIEKIDVLAAKIPEHIEVPDSLG
ncbi:antibiotic biosynthesis monooxygenase [Oxalobacteraceae bacterium R-40]|uniref:Antibiotic biosynthesis monooxygenase n=1 Tax=Keguizhuia sedimenti TaxID=3064264 RepID=A0ABU1BTI7_9BURK|nr:antibiotic biosynthesis monooxygenase [Oxalobacteraceae bacterium R-40]